MRDRTLERLGWIALAALVLAIGLRLIGGMRWFDLYGLAIVALVLTVPLATVLRQGLQARGRAGWLALLVAGPVALAAVAQIGFWLAYFSSPVAGIQLGMGRLMIQLHAAPYLTALTAAWVLLAAWIARRASIGDASDAGHGRSRRSDHARAWYS